MFVFETTNHHVNNVHVYGGNSNDAIHQIKFESLDETIEHITTKVFKPNVIELNNNDDDDDDDFQVFLRCNNDLNFYPSDKSINSLDQLIDQLKTGTKITLQSKRSGLFNSRKVVDEYSFQIYDTNSLYTSVLYVITLYDYCETQHFFETIYEASDYMNGIDLLEFEDVKIDEIYRFSNEPLNSILLPMVII